MAAAQIGPLPAQEAMPELPGWLQALYEHIRQDPMGGMGVLLGSGAPQMRMASPPLARFLDRARQDVPVTVEPEQAIRDFLAQKFNLQLGPSQRLHGVTIKDPLSVSLSSESPTPLKTGIHEGLHAAYNIKSGGLEQLPPRKYWPTLLEWARSRGLLNPRTQVLGGNYSNQAGEQVIDAMSENVLRRNLPRLTQELQ